MPPRPNGADDDIIPRQASAEWRPLSNPSAWNAHWPQARVSASSRPSLLSPLPGLDPHWGPEPSAHALGYHLSVLRTCCISPHPDHKATAHHPTGVASSSQMTLADGSHMQIRGAPNTSHLLDGPPSRPRSQPTGFLTPEAFQRIARGREAIPRVRVVLGIPTPAGVEAHRPALWRLRVGGVQRRPRYNPSEVNAPFLIQTRGALRDPRPSASTPPA